MVFSRQGEEKTNLFRVEILLPVPRHVLGEAYRLVADRDGVLDNSLKLVDGVARAKLPGVRVHGKRHVGNMLGKSALKTNAKTEVENKCRREMPASRSLVR